jgi:hypothetical protein
MPEYRTHSSHEGPTLADSAADCVHGHWYRETPDAYVVVISTYNKSLYDQISPSPVICQPLDS